MNDQNNEYIPISSHEYSHSGFNLKGEKIDKPSSNSHSDYTDSCEVNMLLNPGMDIISGLCNIKIIATGTYFVPVNMDDLYYVSVPRTISIGISRMESQWIDKKLRIT